MNEKGKSCFWTFIKAIGIFILIWVVWNVVVGVVVGGSLLAPSIGNTIKVIYEASRNQPDLTLPPRPTPTRVIQNEGILTTKPRATPRATQIPTIECSKPGGPLLSSGNRDCVRGVVQDIEWGGSWIKDFHEECRIVGGGEKEHEVCSEVPGNPIRVGPDVYNIIMDGHIIAYINEYPGDYTGDCIQISGIVERWKDGPRFVVINADEIELCRNASNISSIQPTQSVVGRPTSECWFVPIPIVDGQEGCVQGYVSSSRLDRRAGR